MSTLPPLPECAPGIYRHYKGQLYQVLGVCRHSETFEPLVVYQALYGTFGLWVRPFSMFVETVPVDGGPLPLPRFTFLGPVGAACSGRV